MTWSIEIVSGTAPEIALTALVAPESAQATAAHFIVYYYRTIILLTNLRRSVERYELYCCDYNHQWTTCMEAVTCVRSVVVETIPAPSKNVEAGRCGEQAASTP